MARVGRSHNEHVVVGFKHAWIVDGLVLRIPRFGKRNDHVVGGRHGDHLPAFGRRRYRRGPLVNQRHSCKQISVIGERANRLSDPAIGNFLAIPSSNKIRSYFDEYR